MAGTHWVLRSHFVNITIDLVSDVDPQSVDPTSFLEVSNGVAQPAVNITVTIINNILVLTNMQVSDIVPVRVFLVPYTQKS